MRTARDVAVKKIFWKDDLILDKSFNREAKMLGKVKLRHPGKSEGLYLTKRV